MEVTTRLIIQGMLQLISYCRVSTFNVRLLESEILEGSITTDKSIRVLLSILFEWSCVCYRIWIIARLYKEMRFTEKKLRIKRKEKLLINQSVYELQ